MSEYKVKKTYKGEETAELWSSGVVLHRYLEYKSSGYYGAIEQLEVKLSALVGVVSKVLTKEQLSELLYWINYEIIDEQD